MFITSKERLISLLKKGMILSFATIVLSSCVAYVSPGPYHSVTWVPGHWSHGHWVPAHYAHHYVGPAYYPGGAVWVPGHWNHYGHWVPGHWRY